MHFNALLVCAYVLTNHKNYAQERRVPRKPGAFWQEINGAWRRIWDWINSFRRHNASMIRQMWFCNVVHSMCWQTCTRCMCRNWDNLQAPLDMCYSQRSSLANVQVPKLHVMPKLSQIFTIAFPLICDGAQICTVHKQIYCFINASPSYSGDSVILLQDCWIVGKTCVYFYSLNSISACIYIMYSHFLVYYIPCSSRNRATDKCMPFFLIILTGMQATSSPDYDARISSENERNMWCFPEQQKEECNACSRTAMSKCHFWGILDVISIRPTLGLTKYVQH